MKGLVLVACCLASAGALAMGQTFSPAPLQAPDATAAPRIPVRFTCDCQDSAGQLFATAFRDALAKSPRYGEIFASSEKIDGKQRDRFHIRAVSIDPSVTNDGTSSSIAVAFLIGDAYFIRLDVQVCGRNRAPECAQQVLSAFDNVVSSLK